MAWSPHMVVNPAGHICMRSTSPAHIFYAYPRLRGVLPIDSRNTAIKNADMYGPVTNNTQAQDLYSRTAAAADDNNGWMDMPPYTATTQGRYLNLAALFSYGSNPLLASLPLSAHNNSFYCNLARLACNVRMVDMFSVADSTLKGGSTVEDWYGRSVNILLTLRCYDYGLGSATLTGDPSASWYADMAGMTAPAFALVGQLRSTFPTAMAGATLATFAGQPGTVGGNPYTWWDALPPAGVLPVPVWNRASYYNPSIPASPLVYSFGATTFTFTSSAWLYVSLAVRATTLMTPQARQHYAAFAGDFELEFNVSAA